MADLDRYDLDDTYQGSCEFCGEDLFEGVIHECPEMEGFGEA